MSIYELFILAVGLSMDAFAVSVCKGLSLGKIKFRHMCIAGAWFGGFQALMPAVGYLLGRRFAGIVSKYSHWIAFALLIIIGANMIKEAFSDSGADNDTDRSMAPKAMLALAVATSIDAFAVGVTFAFLDTAILPAVLIIGLTAFVLSALGVKAGSLFGAKYGLGSRIAGGIILILLGGKILLEGFGAI